MKVINDRFSSWSLKLSCSMCKSTVRIQSGDVKFTQDLDYGGGSDPHFYWVCICGKSHKLKEGEIPPAITDNAIAQYHQKNK